ncbi:Transmembrane protein 243 [Acipenser ruthenus]|uniref:Transmembrane protein 243 n=1 Tax=Acipenser ruthenus TaxID=7906 RepID=A0A662YT41_ACIRT|nr:Transmembrane protein 243 [Acipenser ruthenus]
MEDFTTRTYGTSGLDNRPLFGETSARIVWYRQGDLEPKFRNLIYYFLFSIVLLCICANLYFHDVGK